MMVISALIKQPFLPSASFIRKQGEARWPLRYLEAIEGNVLRDHASGKHHVARGEVQVTEDRMLPTNLE